MIKLEVRELRKSYGTTLAVDNVSLAVEEGKYVVILGPSGCGKTTLLRLTAGYLRPDVGIILVDGAEIAGPSRFVPPERRQMPMVFQNYALWPHMTVAENVGYGLKMRRLPRATIESKIARALEMMRLKALAHRYPSELSGGQQQRVAVARAIVVEPRILLLDEPLSNLDAALRETMRYELRDLQQRLQLTAIHVTHDQREALTLADQLVVMRDGRIAQEGPPHEIYYHPISRFVADFLGTTNLLECEVLGRDPRQGTARLKHPALGDLVASLPQHLEDRARPGERISMSIRPAELALSPAASPGQADNVLLGRISKTVFLGDAWEYRVALADSVEFVVRAGPSARHVDGEEVALSFPAQSAVCLAD